MHSRNSNVIVLSEPGHRVTFNHERLTSGGLVRVQTYWSRDYRNQRDHDIDQMAVFRGRADTLYAGLHACVKPGSGGSQDRFPFMQLDHDDRFGGTGETIAGDLGRVWRSCSWIGVGVYDNDPRVMLGAVPEFATAVMLPGQQPVVVYVGDQDTSACSMLQIVLDERGVHVVFDLVPVALNDYFPTAPEVLAANWNHQLWGNK